MTTYIYNYDNFTCEYLDRTIAFTDPIASKKAGYPVYLIPAYGTLIAPPMNLQKNEVAIFNTDHWEIMEDYRKRWIVNEDLIPEQVEFIGPIEKGYILITEEQKDNLQKDSTYYIFKAGKLEENPANKYKEFNALKSYLYSKNEKIREAFKLSGINYKGIIFDSDDEQKINLMYASSMMSDTDTIEWTGQDGISKLLCSKEDLMQIGLLIQQKISYIWQIRNPEIKSQIMNAKTIEELNAIDISYSI